MHAGPNEKEYAETMKQIAEKGFATGNGAFLGLSIPIFAHTANVSDQFGYGPDTQYCGDFLHCYDAVQQLKW